MDETIQKAITALLGDAAEKGYRWLNSTGDWRKELVGKLRNEQFALMSTTQIKGLPQGFIKKIAGNEESAPQHFFVVQPFGPANSEKWAPTIGIEHRKNFDNVVQVCFYVAFFGNQPTNMQTYKLTSFGHRFDAPEGKKSVHNYYHVQPLKKFKAGYNLPGAFQIHPDTFPTIPIEANDTLDLLLHTLHVACGAKYIEQLATTKINKVVAERAAGLHKKLNLA
ncbi:hypothetical protein [Undibacterium sp. TC9W]|uniref:hypothetical protein n=1 Tax=Undibacterium sp. TC9W TaxID=3413053 RepID=UPI003BEF99A6